jgi:hypothetical protein
MSATPRHARESAPIIGCPGGRRSRRALAVAGGALAVPGWYAARSAFRRPSRPAVMLVDMPLDFLAHGVDHHHRRPGLHLRKHLSLALPAQARRLRGDGKGSVALSDCARPPRAALHARQANGEPNPAAAPSSASISSRRLYFAMRSLRLAEPVLIWPPPIATVKSARNESSVSPERCETT